MPTPPAAPIVGVQLDLKGVAFRPDYLPTLLDDLADRGVNTVLVEYEDVFPFRGRDLQLAWDRRTRWSAGTLRRFLDHAEQRGIEVMPLQQCLGHLQWALAWPRFTRLALDHTDPNTIDLRIDTGRELVLEMLRQVMAGHPHSRFIHLGMDEARGLAEMGRGDALDAYLGWLEVLVAEVAKAGKTPVVWSDMLEDHFDARRLTPWRDRVVLMPWDYGTTGAQVATVRLAGWRTSRDWREEGDNKAAPPLAPGQKALESLPGPLRKLTEPWRDGRWMRALWQVDLWTQLGFRVIGGTAVRFSAHGPVLPRYTQLQGNIAAWSSAIQRTKQMGLIATSWARGTTFGPPNFNVDLCWPLIDELAERMGVTRTPWWRGIPTAKVRSLLAAISRCREDWSIESQLATEMRELEPKLKDHRHEWRSLALMLEVLAWRRRAEFVVAETEHFASANRLPAAQWRRRLRDQRRALRDRALLRKRVLAHFGLRYHGQALREWADTLFEVHAAKMRWCAQVCRAKLAEKQSIALDNGGPTVAARRRSRTIT